MRALVFVLLVACGGSADPSQLPDDGGYNNPPPAPDPDVAVSLRWQNDAPGGCSPPQDDLLKSCAASATVKQGRLVGLFVNYPQCRISQTISTAQIDCTGLCYPSHRLCGSTTVNSFYCPPSTMPKGADPYLCNWTPPP